MAKTELDNKRLTACMGFGFARARPASAAGASLTPAFAAYRKLAAPGLVRFSTRGATAAYGIRSRSLPFGPGFCEIAAGQFHCRRGLPVLRHRSKPGRIAARRKSSALAPGIHNRSAIRGQRQALLPVFGGNRFKHACKFGQCLFARRHKRVAPLNRGDFRHPAIRLIPIQHYLIIIETHPIHIVRRPRSHGAEIGTPALKTNGLSTGLPLPGAGAARPASSQRLSF